MIISVNSEEIKLIYSFRSLLQYWCQLLWRNLLQPFFLIGVLNMRKAVFFINNLMFGLHSSRKKLWHYLFYVAALKHSPSKRKSISRPIRPLEGDFDSTGESNAFRFKRIFIFLLLQNSYACLWYHARNWSVFGM